jgi:hypothetical protein
VTRLPDQWPRPERWVLLQQALIDLIDLLDPDELRFPDKSQRQRLRARDGSATQDGAQKWA